MENLTELSKRVHQNAVDKGFYDKPREVGTLLMLCVSELSEALEADRKGRYAQNRSVGVDYDNISAEVFESCFNHTFENEIADTMIRLLDLCGYMDIDIEKHIELKMLYNSNREKMHGKLY